VRNGFGITQYASKKRKKCQTCLRKAKNENKRKQIKPVEPKNSLACHYGKKQQVQDKGKVCWPLLPAL
jgi:hypothetical protein